MTKHISNDSELWHSLNWKQIKREVFRLQTKIYKAMEVNDIAKCLKLQKLLFNSYSARMLAIRQVTQLNKGKKTAGIDGKKSLNFKQRFALERELKEKAKKWKHNKLRRVQIPKKDGSLRNLKVPTISDRAWQCLVKIILEPAHEATFHAKSYGFRTGRSTHDAQQDIYNHLRKQAYGYEKIIIELDIEKCFDRISHNAIMERLIAPQFVKQGIYRCLKAGVNPEFPSQGTPQGGVVSPLLANIALNGIEDIHPSIRYADDMVFFVRRGKDNPEEILQKVEKFLKERGMNISQKKTKTTATQDGFDFLGWHFMVKNNQKSRCTPNEENFLKFRNKVKTTLANNQLTLEEKVRKLAPIVRGWRKYHQYCYMEGSRWSLFDMQYAAYQKFLKTNKNLNRYKAKEMLNKAFPRVPVKQGKHVKVKGNKSPYDGDLIYWAKRKSKQFDNITAKVLRKQEFKCKECGLNFWDEEEIHLHHIDGNHSNWKRNNLVAIHKSCHMNIHWQKGTKT